MDRIAPDRPARSGDAESAPEVEIEVTPEMAEAGASEYLRGNTDFDFEEEIAAKIYRRMEGIRRAHLSKLGA